MSSSSSPYTPWGQSVAISLYNCDLKLISDPKIIKKFIAEVIVVVDMVAHGPCHIERFGIGELEGYSAMQFIETSSITVHCDEPGRRCFIDIFSCKNFDSRKAADFSSSYFKAGKINSFPLIR